MRVFAFINSNTEPARVSLVEKGKELLMDILIFKTDYLDIMIVSMTELKFFFS